MIAVDVNFDGARFFGQPRTALGVMTRVFVAVEKIVSNQERATADLMITPKVGHIPLGSDPTLRGISRAGL